MLQRENWDCNKSHFCLLIFLHLFICIYKMIDNKNHFLCTWRYTDVMTTLGSTPRHLLISIFVLLRILFSRGFQDILVGLGRTYFFIISYYHVLFSYFNLWFSLYRDRIQWQLWLSKPNFYQISFLFSFLLVFVLRWQNTIYNVNKLGNWTS